MALTEAPAGWLTGHRLLLKREDEHELGAFKWRGALPVMAGYRDRGIEQVVTVSTGNHGAASAWAAARHGMVATVFVPEACSETKLELLRRAGADLHQAGADLDEAKQAAFAYARERGLPLFEDGDEPAQLGGYAAIADEILDDLTPGAVVVPVGNGALLNGIGLRMGERAPAVRRIGVAAARAPVMARSFAAGHVVESDSSDTFADGMAVRVAIPSAVELLAQAADAMVEVSERRLAEAVGLLAGIDIRAEGSAAAALAGALALGDELPDPAVLIVTGRNIDEALWRRAVEQPETFAD
jgi:threonine dehydratase